MTITSTCTVETFITFITLCVVHGVLVGYFTCGVHIMHKLFVDLCCIGICILGPGYLTVHDSTGPPGVMHSEVSWSGVPDFLIFFMCNVLFSGCCDKPSHDSDSTQHKWNAVITVL